MMRKTFLAALMLIGGCTFIFAAGTQRQEAADSAKVRETTIRELEEDPTRAFTPLYNYPYSGGTDTAAPKGYKPFYISHYGRHGARADTKYDGYMERLRAQLVVAGKAGLLTERGKDMIRQIDEATVEFRGMTGRLTPKGVRELAGIADRMAKRYPGVFTKNGKVRSVSSTSARCLISMNSFTNSLQKHFPTLTIYPDAGDVFNLYVRVNNKPSTVFGPERDRILDSLDRFENYDKSHTPALLFNDPARAAALIPDPDRFQDDLYRTLRFAGNYDVENPDYALLGTDYLYKKYLFNITELYATNGCSVEFASRRLDDSLPLVDDIVKKADENIVTGRYVADLRFGHDSKIISLLAYMDIQGIGERMNMADARFKWKGWAYMPTASNLQMIFYRKRSGGDILVKFLYQEQEVLLSEKVKPFDGPYYRWEDVKGFWKERADLF